MRALEARGEWVRPLKHGPLEASGGGSKKHGSSLVSQDKHMESLGKTQEV